MMVSDMCNTKFDKFTGITSRFVLVKLDLIFFSYICNLIIVI